MRFPIDPAAGVTAFDAWLLSAGRENRDPGRTEGDHALSRDRLRARGVQDVERHHFIGDFRWYLAACALGLYARAVVILTPYDRERRMPLPLAFVLIGFFIWLAENLSTFYGVWQYPHQLSAWSAVHVGKWSSWSLLVIMTFTIVANLKHVKARIHIPE